MLPRPTERKITFEQFLEALKLLAERKYGSASEVGKLEAAILKSEGPQTSGTTVSFCEFLYGRQYSSIFLNWCKVLKYIKFQKTTTVELQQRSSNSFEAIQFKENGHKTLLQNSSHDCHVSH